MDEVIIKELIPQVVAGDQFASGGFYELTKTHVYRTIYFLYEYKDEIDDITQEVYYQLFKLVFSSWKGMKETRGSIEK